MPVVSAAMGKFDGVLFAEGGELAQYYAKVRKAATAEKLKHFVALTKVEEQAKFVLGLADTPKVEATTSIRDIEKAREYKETGNDFFRKHQYIEAKNNYTLAIQHCPVDEANPEDPVNKDYSIFFANRSAALDGAGQYQACIHDVDLALKFGYPRELWYKIYKRKGHACIKMKQYLLAKDALEISLKNIGRSDIKKEKDRDNYRMRVRKQMTVFNVTKTLYNCEFVERPDSCLAGGQLEDRGLCRKLAVQEDGKQKALVATEAVGVEDHLVALDPYVALVNVTGGRAGGKLCPHSLEKMFHPVPCSFGSLQTFCTFEARDAANGNYHRFEWKVLAALEKAGTLERARLALRMVTQLEPDQVDTVAACLAPSGPPAPPELLAAVQTFQLAAGVHPSDEERLVSTALGLYLLRCLEASGFTTAGRDQSNLLSLLQQALLTALRHTKEITLFDVPKEKKNFLDGEVKTDVCAFGIYPELSKIEAAGTGSEQQAFHWFLDKKLVITAFRRIEAGSPVCLVEEASKGDKSTKPQDMITFRCANALCSVSFPLKENTKEKIISCPLDECGVKTNIWERLKLIQKLKKDFSAAKEEFVKNDVGLAKDIIRLTLEEWDRIIVRPYREVDQLQALLVKSLLCEVADQERKVIEGNQFGMMVSKKQKIDVYPKDDPELEGMTSKMIEIK